MTVRIGHSASPVEKRALVKQLQRELARDLAALRQAAMNALEAATHEEARPENDKDTRAVEASYLAGAQAERVRDLESTMNALEFLELRAFSPSDPISVGALVELDKDGEAALYFIAPQGGGMKTVFEEREVLVITPRSPVGAALTGKFAGDEVEVSIAGKRRQLEIVSVS